MCDEQTMKNWFRINPQNFLKAYWLFIVKRAYLLMAIYGTMRLQEADWLRLYKQSVFYRWRLMIFCEFMELVEIEISRHEKRLKRKGE